MIIFSWYWIMLYWNMPLKENTNDNGCKFPFYKCHYLNDILLKMKMSYNFIWHIKQDESVNKWQSQN